MIKRAPVWLFFLALFTATFVGCVLLRDAKIPSEWEPLLAEIRAFEQRIGFEGGDAFLEFSSEEGGHAFCGQVSRLYLPYSYEDPAIRWLDEATEQDCRSVGDNIDFYYGTVEALGEVGAAVTPEVLEVPLHRFVYLVIHEDCHDQFEFPYGIEEALCNLIAYKGMAEFSSKTFRTLSRANLTIRRYASMESEHTRTVKSFYEQLAGHYARYERKEISTDNLLQERARILGRAERALRWKRGSLNNVGIANEMTYSRHYPLLEGVHEALGSDLARTVAFFRQVDRARPSPAAVRKRHRLPDETSVEFIRAYEAAVLETIEQELAKLPQRQ